ncbi:MAG: dinitrogenase iron-molybdenum cofactor biosynthesis protein [Acidobacteria bacterium]|nr:dinitrogenase iron-molybdenum cofactor biosynthesis protein [Acidobacteriota bacterium]
MNVALTVWNDRISPVFDVSRKVMLASVDQGSVLEQKELELPSGDPYGKLDTLLQAGVDLLICGAISRPVEGYALSRGLGLIPFTAGEAGQILSAYLDGSLQRPDFRMPGCRRRRFQGGGMCRRRGGGGRHLGH